MFYGSPQQLEQSLQNDFNAMIKNIKMREDMHLSLLQYNKGLIGSVTEMDSIPFLQEEINKHKSFYAAVEKSHERMKGEERILLEKYESTSCSENNIIKLINRGTVRILQILQNSLQKCKFLDDKLTVKFHHIKQFLMKEITSDKIEIHELLQEIVNFSAIKNLQQIQKLNEIINILINGQFPSNQNQTKISAPIVKKEEQIVEEGVVGDESKKIQRKQFKKSLDSNFKQRTRLKKEQNQSFYKVRNDRVKVAHRLLTCLDDVMQISKQHFNASLNFSNVDQHRKVLYTQIWNRNRLNQQQILSFEKKKDLFYRKIAQFKQKMKQQSQKIEQSLNFIQNRPNLKAKRNMPIIYEQKNENVTISSHAKSQEDQKYTVNFVKKQIQYQSSTVSMKKQLKNNFQTKYQIDCSRSIFNRTNRSKLPHISNRTSLDERDDKIRQIKSKNDRNDKKAMLIIKNMEMNSYRFVKIKKSSDLGSMRKSQHRGQSVHDDRSYQIMGNFDFIAEGSHKQGLNPPNRQYKEISRINL